MQDFSGAYVVFGGNTPVPSTSEMFNYGTKQWMLFPFIDADYGGRTVVVLPCF